MAFTGTPLVTPIADDMVLISGISLAASAAGTISLLPGTGEAKITAPTWLPSTSGTSAVTLQNAINAVVNRVSTVAATAIPPRVVKSGTNTQAGFLLTITNDDSAAASGTLEILVTFKS